MAISHLVAGAAGPIGFSTWGPVDSGHAPVLLVHGANLSGGACSDVVARLPPDRLYVAPDLRGHGTSTREGELDVASWADDCEAVWASLGYGPLHLVGNSLGAAVAVALAARAPQCTLGLCTVGGAFLPVAPIDRDDGLEQAVGRRGVAAALRALLAEAAFAPGATVDLVDRAARDQSDNPPEIALAIDQAAYDTDVRPHLAHLRFPILVVSGDLDTMCPIVEAEWFAAQTGGRLEVLSGVGHLPMYEAPQMLADLLTAHIRRCDDQSRSSLPQLRTRP